MGDMIVKVNVPSENKLKNKAVSKFRVEEVTSDQGLDRIEEGITCELSLCEHVPF